MKINHSFLIVLVTLPLFINPGFTQTTKNAASAGKQNIHLWKSVDSLLNLSQPKSALAIVEKIYAQSRKEQNDPQFLKAMLYRIRLNSDFQEDFIIQTLRNLQNEMRVAAEPAASVLHSIIAEVYWKYYQNNEFRFRNRSAVDHGSGTSTLRSDSIATWDLSTISEAIANEYLLSLASEKLLKGIPVSAFSAILELPAGSAGNLTKRAEAPTDNSRPTLFDFLAFRALDYFTSDPVFPGQPDARFSLDRPDFFSPTKKFVSLLGGPISFGAHFLKSDSISPYYLSFRIYQSLAAFHIHDKDPNALIATELDRLALMKKNAPGTDSLYLPALKQLEIDYLSSPFSTNVSFAIADFLRSSGEKYSPLLSNDHKWDLKSAVESCDKAIRLFPNSIGAKNCKILNQTIRSSTLTLTTEDAVPAEKPSLALLAFNNINLLHFRLIKADPDTYYEKSGSMKREDFYKYISTLSIYQEWTLSLPSDGDLQRQTMEIAVPGCPSGFFILICSVDKKFVDTRQPYAITPFWSTRISYIHKRNNDGSISMNLLDRETGTALKNVRAEAWFRSYNYASRKYQSIKLGEYTSDETGLILMPSDNDNSRSNSIYFRILLKDDLLITQGFYQYPVSEPSEYSSIQTSFFTDRAIYRPGQTIYFKGIVLQKTGEKPKIKPGHITKVTFYDVNGQKIAEQSYVSGDFGSFHGSFTAPTGLLTGQMTISNESGSVSISVEEYKRPTFEVIYSPLEGNYKLGETVTVAAKATAYAGNSIDGATVKYRVVRTARFPWWGRGGYWPMPSSPETEIASGLIKTLADGSFSFSFSAIPDPSVEKSSAPVFDYEVFADVTDLGGESQAAQQTISVGYKSLLISATIPALVNLSKDSVFKLSTTNLNGRNTPVNVTFSLQRLQQPDRAFKSRMWTQPDLYSMTKEEFHSKFPFDIFRDEDNPETWNSEGVEIVKIFNTATDSLINIQDPTIGKLKPGSYKVTLSAKDPFGQTVENKIIFTVFDPASLKVPVNKMSWFVPLKTSGEPGEKAIFLIGSREENVNVMYEIRLHDSLVSRQWINLNNRAARLEIQIEERYRGNFAVNFVFVKHNRVFQYSQLITVPYTNKNLDITFETFRSKLSPGAKEEWNLTIAGSQKKVAEAELVTTMYDASLDVFRPNNWSFDLYPRYFPVYPWDINDAFRSSGAAWAGGAGTDGTYSMASTYRLNWFGLSYFTGYNYDGYRRTRSQIPLSLDASQSDHAVGGKAEEKMAPQEVIQTVADSGTISGRADGRTPKSPNELMGGIQIRKDFRETAFFYPSLVTDSTGNLILKFTAPESLTRWKMMGLAITKNLEYGSFEKELVTRKELMVFPNAPRFVRQGDTLVFTTRIVNLSDHDLAGEIQLQLFNGLTMKPLDSLIKQQEKSGSFKSPWTAGKGLATSVSWTVSIPTGTDLSVLIYRITARSGNFSDGEEKAIPVLTNRMMVTESQPLPVRGKGTFDFSFEKLLRSGESRGESGTLKNYRFTLEFASNPAWYAIQALPTLNEKQYDNADAIFSAFYSNSIASHIANSSQKIKAVFEAWKNLTPDALLSNLEKNEDLKSALLKETPWIFEATSETERKQRLGLFFDPDNLNSNLQESLKKLQKLQKPGGGWTWFEGMPESRWITQNIITGFGHLGQLGVPGIRTNGPIFNMITNAIRYLDKELFMDYDNLRKNNQLKPEENHLSSAQIQYLYARSYFQDIKMEDEGCRKAFEYYQQQAAKFWQPNDRYLQGMIALALNRLGNKETPGLIVKSLSQNAIHSPEMGMYWAGEPGYSWYQAPVETQAMMMEVFDEITRDEKSVEEMKIWLLKQKQTQSWRSSRATVEAVYALLLRGSDLLSEEPGVIISLGNEKIDSRKLTDVKTEAGTGYFRKTWQGSAVNPEMGLIKITKTSDGTAWGSAYWQYFENLDKITPAATPMKLEKQLFLETNTPAGPVLVALAENQPLHRGDKIRVRIILKIDRNLEFVHMKDMRASAFEPGISAKSGFSDDRTNLSGYRYQDGLGYYQSTTDVATNFFFEFLPKGTYVFEYPLKANTAGEYSNGITTIQCLYAPEFSAHSEGIRVRVNE